MELDPYAADIRQEAMGFDSTWCDCGCERDLEMEEMIQERRDREELEDFLRAFPQYREAGNGA